MMIRKFVPPISMEQPKLEPFISPQVVFVRATGSQRRIDISFPIHQLQQMIDGLQRIKNENDEYFDEL